MSDRTADPPNRPPIPRREPVTRSLHGVDRVDPYAWMRAVDSAEVREHLEAERAYYDAAVRHTAPRARALAAATIARIPDSEWGVEVERERWTYRSHRADGREHGEIRRRPRDPHSLSGMRAVADPEVGPEWGEVVLDIDDLRGDSDYVDVGLCEFSPDETLVAYSVDRTGDEVYELRFRDLATGADLPDRVMRSYYTGAWDAAGASFFYTVHDEAYRPYEVRRHVLGTDAASDALVFTEADEQYEVTVAACRSGRLIVISTENRDTTEQWLIDPAAPAEPPRCVQPRRRGLEYRVEHAPYDDPAGQHDRLLVLTNHGAEEFRLMWAPLDQPGLASWRDLVSPDPSQRLLSVDAFANFVAVWLRTDTLPQVQILSLDGRLLHTLRPPACGHVELAENPRWDADRLLVERYAHLVPRLWSAVDPLTGEETVRHREEAPNFDSDAYESSRIWVTARDGVTVPVTVLRRGDVPLDGTAPCLLYGYGAYEAVFEPEYDPSLITLLDQGVVFAFAGIRGGGDGGRRWWLDGRLEHKHHTFDDYLDVADALARDHVDGTRLATRGLSAGGLLQGAVFSQRPDRWRAVIAEVPFVDVITTMLDASIPLTANEWDEWGDPRRAADFGWMLEYSPYDNLPPAGSRPDLLVTGAVHDARVMVWEPAKWVAALRESDPGWAPRCVFRVDLGPGAHTGPSGRYAKAEYEAEIYAWLLDALSPLR
jgi:oligopeptidase B